MVKHQSGTLNKTSEGEEVKDVMSTSLDLPLYYEMKRQLGDEETGTSVIEDKDIMQETDEEVLPDLDAEDWMSKLHEDEIFNADKGPAPRLYGLRRLAKPYILAEESKVNALIVVQREYMRTLKTCNGKGDVMSQSDQVCTHYFPMASVTFLITLRDGRTFSDSADAYFPSIGGDESKAVGLHPTAVASARAEARTLRKVLGIREHAAEELVDKDAGEELAPDDDSAIKPEQAKLIDKMLKSLDTSLKELLETITIREIFSVEELTTGEARKALRLLNDQKKKNKKKGGKKS